MGSRDSAWLRTRGLAAVARRPALHRTARWTARLLAGRHYVAAVAVVVDGDDIVVARHRFHGDQWALPGGWVRRHEDPAEACTREVAEELGLVVESVALVAAEVHTLDGRPVRYAGLTLAYRCEPRDVIDRTQPPQSIEISGVLWLDRASCARYLGGFQLAAVDAAFRCGATGLV
jgi:8-oxo-dGTP pyrophosphatase MutT (NUDIX family)